MGTMPARRIIQLGDPLLREVSQPIADPAASRALFTDLADTLAEFRRTHGFGRGISAIQIGTPLRAIYMEVDGVAYSLVNPHFVWMSERLFELWDDCFSFPNLMVHLRRHYGVHLEYTTPEGGVKLLQAEGPLSELIQHEMDHLDGVLAIDRAMDRNSFATREEYLRRHCSAALSAEAT